MFGAVQLALMPSLSLGFGVYLFIYYSFGCVCVCVPVYLVLFFFDIVRAISHRTMLFFLYIFFGHECNAHLMKISSSIRDIQAIQISSK